MNTRFCSGSYKEEVIYSERSPCQVIAALSFCEVLGLIFNMKKVKNIQINLLGMSWVLTSITES